MKRKNSKIILGIETSCDETSAAVVQVTSYKLPVTRFEIFSNIVMSQIAIHKKYGGVVPEVAARNHVKNIIPAIALALREIKMKPKDIDQIAVTYGPGLITSLMVGVETARTLSYVWKKPLVPVDHIKAHAFAALIAPSPPSSAKATAGGRTSPQWGEGEIKKISRPFGERMPSRTRAAGQVRGIGIEFPVLALIVSGGHTELLFIKKGWRFEKIGQTIDDAAGEAFDKVGKMLKLGFPGGPHVARLAERGNPKAIDFPRPMLYTKDYNFSFSGLKTSVLYHIQKSKNLQATSYKLQADICASFQQAVVDVLTAKTIRAAKAYKVKTLILGGGVAANELLRKTLEDESSRIGIPFVVPPIKLCTDNAAPIAIAGYFGKPEHWSKIKVDPNLDRVRRNQ